MEQSLYGVSVPTPHHYELRFDRPPQPFTEDLRHSPTRAVDERRLPWNFARFVLVPHSSFVLWAPRHLTVSKLRPDLLTVQLNRH
jgi:hypothetical protein